MRLYFVSLLFVAFHPARGTTVESRLCESVLSKANAQALSELKSLSEFQDHVAVLVEVNLGLDPSGITDENRAEKISEAVRNLNDLPQRLGEFRKKPGHDSYTPTHFENGEMLLRGSREELLRVIDSPDIRSVKAVELTPPSENEAPKILSPLSATKMDLSLIWDFYVHRDNPNSLHTAELSNRDIRQIVSLAVGNKTRGFGPEAQISQDRRDAAKNEYLLQFESLITKIREMKKAGDLSRSRFSRHFLTLTVTGTKAALLKLVRDQNVLGARLVEHDEMLEPTEELEENGL